MPIPSSNLILLVKDMNCPLDDPHYKITLTPKLYTNNSCSLPERPLLYRRRPASCISHHQNVIEVSQTFRLVSFWHIFSSSSSSLTGIEHRSMWTWQQNINQRDAFSNNIYTRSHSLTIYFKFILRIEAYSYHLKKIIRALILIVFRNDDLNGCFSYAPPL